MTRKKEEERQRKKKKKKKKKKNEKNHKAPKSPKTTLTPPKQRKTNNPPNKKWLVLGVYGFSSCLCLGGLNGLWGFRGAFGDFTSCLLGGFRASSSFVFLVLLLFLVFLFWFFLFLFIFIASGCLGVWVFMLWGEGLSVFLDGRGLVASCLLWGFWVYSSSSCVFLVFVHLLFFFLSFFLVSVISFLLIFGSGLPWVGFHLFFFSWLEGFGGFLGLGGFCFLFFFLYLSCLSCFLLFFLIFVFFIFPFISHFFWFVLGVVCGFSCVLFWGVGGFWWFLGFRSYFVVLLSSLFFSIFLLLFVLILVPLFLFVLGGVKKERQVKKRDNKDKRRRKQKKKPKGPLTNMRPQKPPRTPINHSTPLPQQSPRPEPCHQFFAGKNKKGIFVGKFRVKGLLYICVNHYFTMVYAVRKTANVMPDPHV